jgi:hypothetical protein
LRVPYFGRLSFLYTKNTSRHRPAKVCMPATRECPDLAREAYIFECLECEKYKIWHGMDGFKRCYYEFKELESRGFYDGTFDSHPENFDPETFARIQERKRLNEEVNRELESERPELARKAEELAANDSPSNYYEYYWEHESEEESEEEEEPDQTDDDDEEDYF